MGTEEEKGAELLRGNFETRRDVQDVREETDELEDRFEQEALKRLGGSIAFVSKRRVMWDASAEQE